MSDDRTIRLDCQEISEPLHADAPLDSPVDCPNKVKESPCCKVPGCKKVLIGLKRYHRRYKICPDHLKMSVVIINGDECRFCQLCGKFQPLCDFDGTRRSCRTKLARHNERRQKYKKTSNEKASGDDNVSAFQRMGKESSTSGSWSNKLYHGTLIASQLPFQGSSCNPSASNIQHGLNRVGGQLIDCVDSGLPMHNSQFPGYHDRYAHLADFLLQCMAVEEGNNIIEKISRFQRDVKTPDPDVAKLLKMILFDHNQSGHHSSPHQIAANHVLDNSNQQSDSEGNVDMRTLMNLLELITKAYLARG